MGGNGCVFPEGPTVGIEQLHHLASRIRAMERHCSGVNSGMAATVFSAYARSSSSCFARLSCTFHALRRESSSE